MTYRITTVAQHGDEAGKTTTKQFRTEKEALAIWGAINNIHNKPFYMFGVLLENSRIVECFTSVAAEKNKQP